MDDLISRKALIKKIFYSENGERYPFRDIDNFPAIINLEDLRKIIAEQPTAFDVDKVIEELEEIKEECRSFEEYEYANGIDRAIAIVKGGSQG